MRCSSAGSASRSRASGRSSSGGEDVGGAGRSSLRRNRGDVAKLSRGSVPPRRASARRRQANARHGPAGGVDGGGGERPGGKGGRQVGGEDREGLVGEAAGRVSAMACVEAERAEPARRMAARRLRLGCGAGSVHRRVLVRGLDEGSRGGRASGVVDAVERCWKKPVVVHDTDGQWREMCRLDDIYLKPGG